MFDFLSNQGGRVIGHLLWQNMTIRPRAAIERLDHSRNLGCFWNHGLPISNNRTTSASLIARE